MNVYRRVGSQLESNAKLNLFFDIKADKSVPNCDISIIYLKKPNNGGLLKFLLGFC